MPAERLPSQSAAKVRLAEFRWRTANDNCCGGVRFRCPYCIPSRPGCLKVKCSKWDGYATVRKTHVLSCRQMALLVIRPIAKVHNASTAHLASDSSLLVHGSLVLSVGVTQDEELFHVPHLLRRRGVQGQGQDDLCRKQVRNPVCMLCSYYAHPRRDAAPQAHDKWSSTSTTVCPANRAMLSKKLQGSTVPDTRSPLQTQEARVRRQLHVHRQVRYICDAVPGGRQVRQLQGAAVPAERQPLPVVLQREAYRRGAVPDLRPLPGAAGALQMPSAPLTSVLAERPHVAVPADCQ